MAKKVITEITDDITGAEGAETRTLFHPLEGTAYEIDLADETFKKMQAAVDRTLGKYFDHGTAVKMVHTRGGHKRAKVTKVARVGADTAAVRDWARQNGFPDVSSRGRVSKEIQDAFDAAHSH